MDIEKNIIKQIYSNLLYYKDNNVDTCIELSGSPGLQIIGKVNKLTRWNLFSHPSCIIDKTKFFLYEINPDKIFSGKDIS